MNKNQLREQIQNDVIAYIEPLLGREYEFTSDNVDDLCQIVVDNFKKFENCLEIVTQLSEVNCRASISNGIMTLEDGTQIDLLSITKKERN